MQAALLRRSSRWALLIPVHRLLSTATAATVMPTHLNQTKPHVCLESTVRWPSCLNPDAAYSHLKNRSYLTQPIPLTEKQEVVYEITLEVDEDIVPDYLDWMRSGHIQETLSLPGFVSWELNSAEETEAKTQGEGGKKRKVFVETYIMASKQALQDYYDKYAHAIRADHTRMWEGKVSASRRILTPLSLQDAKEAQLWKDREARNQFRLRNLEEQVPAIQKFTQKGYHVMRTPAQLWDKIQAFYDTHKHEAVLESINPIEVSINTWVAPTYKLDYDDELTREIHTTVRPILEEWSGISSLEYMGMSGIRFYQPGATIAEHVDLATTNVISALIHVGHEVDEPWPFEIKDHAGSSEAVDLQPGDMIIYESAACAHARRAPLKGNYYANTFMRFKPTNWTWDYTY